eukprot:1462174-Pyramimonas_sp.AAC.1
MDQAPLYPRAPVVLKLKDLSHMSTINQQVHFKAFPMELTGPTQAPVVYNWSWEVGASADLNPMVKEWFEFSERRLIQIHGIDP